jgi:hypothetical protein
MCNLNRCRVAAGPGHRGVHHSARGLPVPAHVGILMNLTPCVGNSGRQRARPPCCVRQELAAGVIFQTTLP